jgi:hypothetical protein
MTPQKYQFKTNFNFIVELEYLTKNQLEDKIYKNTVNYFLLIKFIF